jgi:hypothetical protein
VARGALKLLDRQAVALGTLLMRKAPDRSKAALTHIAAEGLAKVSAPGPIFPNGNLGGKNRDG